MKESSGNIETASTKLTPLLEDGGKALERVYSAASAAERTFATLESGANSLQEVLASANGVMDKAGGSFEQLDASLKQIRRLIGEIENGDGIASVLIKDKEFKEDLTGLVDKLDRRGVLFYPVERRQQSRQGARGADDEKERKPLLKPIPKPTP